MSVVYFISDLHLGHRSIMKHTQKVPGAYRGRSDFMVDPTNPIVVKEHDDWVMAQLHSLKADKRTIWWIMGDVAMETERLELIASLPGRKRLVLGNHDLFDTQVYLKYFERLTGTVKKYGMWISHVPMHPLELLGLPNLHGHCHRNTVKDDPRYLNMAIDWAPHHLPLSLEQIRAIFTERGVL